MIPPVRNSGEVEKVFTFEIERITAELPQIYLGPIITFFSGIKLQDIKYPVGHVDLLIVVHEARLFPNQVLQTRGNLLLHQSIFGSGILLSCHHPLIQSGEVHQLQQAQALHNRSHHVLTRHSVSSPPTSSVDLRGPGE